MKIFIAISRQYPALKTFRHLLAQLPPDTVALLGDNPGAEQQLILALYTANPAVRQEVYRADWARYHTQARQLRDARILAQADEVIALDTGTDHYILSVIDHANRHCTPLNVYGPAGLLEPRQPNIYDFQESPGFPNFALDSRPAIQ